jgi:hypothetical protein
MTDPQDGSMGGSGRPHGDGPGSGAGGGPAPLISVVMPAYTCERYVAPTVESILAQTFPDCELLIIDDGSTDKTPGILRRYAARDPRIHLVSRPNRRLVASLNEGLRLVPRHNDPPGLRRSSPFTPGGRHPRFQSVPSTTATMGDDPNLTECGLRVGS